MPPGGHRTTGRDGHKGPQRGVDLLHLSLADFKVEKETDREFDGTWWLEFGSLALSLAKIQVGRFQGGRGKIQS